MSAESNVVNINKKIITVSVKDKSNVDKTKHAVIETLSESLARPYRLTGDTYKLKSPLTNHAAYITINNIVLNPNTAHENIQPYEMFINSKDMKNYQWVAALTRMISAVFRKGGDITFILDELGSVIDPSDQGGYLAKGGKWIPSLVAEIGEIIKEHFMATGIIEADKPLDGTVKEYLDGKKDEYLNKSGDEVHDNGFPKSSVMCPKCNHKAMIPMDNCLTCLNCGDSKCGS